MIGSLAYLFFLHNGVGSHCETSTPFHALLPESVEAHCFKCNHLVLATYYVSIVTFLVGIPP